jgi:hypothetical protein
MLLGDWYVKRPVLDAMVALVRDSARFKYKLMGFMVYF